MKPYTEKKKWGTIMRMKPFGKTGLEVSEYGLGTWAMGGGIYGRVDDGESIRTIHRAEDLGVNFIDTAPMFGISELRDGRAERVVGEALRDRRERWVVATKFGRHLNGKAPWWEMYEDYSGEEAIASVEDSLTRLGTDYIDVLFVHSPPPKQFNPEDTFEAMARLKKEGKIRAVGFSFGDTVEETLGQVEPYLRSGVLEAVQMKFNLLWPNMVEQMLMPIVRRTGTAVVARQTMAGGFLTGSFTAETEFDAEDYKSKMPPAELQKTLDRAERFRFLIDQARGVPTLMTAAIHWTLSHPEITVAIPGAKTPEELDQCLLAADAQYYTPEQLQKVIAIQKGWT